MRCLIPCLSVAVLLACSAVGAEVVESTPAGFQVKGVYVIAASPAKVYEAYSNIGNWWSSEHSWSGKAQNMTLDPRAGGCFCEKLKDGGSVQHMIVIMAQPDQLLRLSGALGPLQSGALSGTLTLSTVAKDKSTELTMTYSVAGYFPGGLDGVAPAVDGVLASQMGRLRKYVETGKPD